MKRNFHHQSKSIIITICFVATAYLFIFLALIVIQKPVTSPTLLPPQISPSTSMIKLTTPSLSSATLVADYATPPTPLPTTGTTTSTATSVIYIVPTPIPLGGRDVEHYIFAVCGDNRGGDDIYREILRQVESDGAAFLVNTGDLVHRGVDTQFQHFAELMSDFTLPFFPVAGNHDTATGILDIFLEYSGAPAEHYSFDYGLGHFTVVDSHLGWLQARELAWLEADLAATDQSLIFVFLHHPPFDPDGTDYIMRFGNDEFMALMEEFDVSYVFTGHIHAYAASLFNGVHYIITGGAGAPLYSAEHPNAFYHYIRVTVNGTEVSTEVIIIEPPQ